MKADIVIIGNSIFDSIGETPFAGYIAVKGNRIIETGTSEPTDLIGPQTRVVDAGDNLVTAGFHDSHAHLTMAGMYRTYANLGKAASEEETARLLKEFCDTHPDVCGVPEGTPEEDSWIYGFNWHHIFWDVKELPQRKTLDRYFPVRPVLLINAEAHAAWVNSRALEIAGITDMTPNPFGGEIERDAEGHATGVLHDNAMSFCIKKAYVFTKEQEKIYLRNFMEAAAKLGITGVVDVEPYFGRQLGNLEAFYEMEQDGELSVRITAAQDLYGDLDKVVENSRKYRTDFLRAHMLKHFTDGVFPAHTALLFEDYTDAPGSRGRELFQLDNLPKQVEKAHAKGLWIKIHAIGDRAVSLVLDCYENAIEKYGDMGCRHAIEHVELAREEDILRFGKLKITPSVQPEHVGLIPKWEDEPYFDVLGEERANKTWAFRDLLEQTEYLALGSDCPVVDNNPYLGIHRGMTRVHNDGLPANGWNPEQKLTLAEVITGYTYGSAYGIGREDDLGTLEAGKLADIVITDGDLFKMKPEEIRKASPLMTIVNGRVVYETKTT